MFEQFMFLSTVCVCNMSLLSFSALCCVEIDGHHNQTVSIALIDIKEIGMGKCKPHREKFRETKL